MQFIKERLILDATDLDERYQDWEKHKEKWKEGVLHPHPIMPTREIEYEHLNKSAKKAVDATGLGVFISWNRREYKKIEPPRIPAEKGPALANTQVLYAGDVLNKMASR